MGSTPICVVMGWGEGAQRRPYGACSPRSMRSPVNVAHLHLQLNVHLERLVLGCHAKRHAQDLACGVKPLGAHLQLCGERPDLRRQGRRVRAVKL
eukprot:359219-Chlamydomonas_euryale.AAC.2